MGVYQRNIAAAQKNVADAGAYRHQAAEPIVAELPLVPASLLPRIFGHLSLEERGLALRQRLVPIAWLPHVTLYASAARELEGHQSTPETPIIARINPDDFDTAVRVVWRQVLGHVAAFGLDDAAPALSARRGALWQAIVGISLAVTVAAAFWLAPSQSVLNVLGGLCSLFFLMVIWLRLLALLGLPRRQRDKPEMDDEALPVYSVLVPLFRETSVLPQLLQALKALNYPARKLDIKLILEESDAPMRRAIEAMQLPPQIEVLVVPQGKPQTKPRALNYALQFARGDLLTIYDAEDIPEPMQLRMAARRFASSPQKLACLQAELAFYNSNENWLTRQFTIEYAVLFRLFLPSLARLRWPLPLGGTSNHFRTQTLLEIGGWDAFNVTEDADLGFRLARLGYATDTLASITYEEASSTPGNWLKQRSRWLKGFLVTWLVHMRQPVRTFNELGIQGSLILHAVLLGVMAAAVVHPIFLGLALWKFAQSSLATHGLQAVLDAYFFALFPVSWAIMLLTGRRALHRMGIRGWWFSLLSMPCYWLCISIASYMALWEFFTARTRWNKTQHGLSRLMAPPAGRRRSA